MLSRFVPAATARTRPAARKLAIENLEHREVPATFGSGNLALLVTTETDSNSPAVVVEINTTTASQSAIQTIATPDTGSADSYRISASGTSTGYVALSNDRTLLTFTGANSTNTTSNVNTLNPRGVYTVNNAGAVVKQTTYTGGSGNQTRGATSVNNTAWYVGDQGGFYSNGTSAGSPTGNIRSVKSFGGTVYGFTASASIPAVGIISAPTGGTYTALAGLPNGTTAMQDFYMVQSGDHGSTFDMLYVLSATSATVGSIAKYSLFDTNGNSTLGDAGDQWVTNGAYTTDFGGFGLAAADAGSGETLYVTSGNGGTVANTVRKLTDAAGYNTAINVTTANNVTLYTSAAGTIIKGLDFTPVVPNQAPVVAANTGLTVGEGATDTITTAKLQATDAEQGAASLTYTVGAAPANGALKKSGTTLNANDTFTQDDIDTNKITYAHGGGEAAADSFTFTVSDGAGGSVASTFNITVTAVNDAPTLTTNAGLTGVVLGTTATITSAILTVSDADNSAVQIAYTVGTTPTGTLKKNGTTLNASDTFTQDDINNSLVTYTAPATGTADSFTFTVSDGAGGAIGSTTFNITLAAGNTDPTLAANTGLTVGEGATDTITTAKLQATDAEQGAASLTYTVGTAPANGALKKSGTTLVANDTFTQDDIDTNKLTYAHGGGEAGSDSFTFTVSDGAGGAIAATTFAITVSAVNDAPVVAVNTGLTVAEGDAATIIGTDKLAVTDADNTPAQTVFTVTAVPAHGTLAKNGTPLAVNETFTQVDLNDNLITYANNGDEAAADNFKFTVSDGAGGSVAETTFAIAVTPVNDNPVIAINRTLTLNPGQRVAISNAILLAADDNAPAALAYTVSTAPTKGLITKGAAEPTTFTQADLNAGDTFANAIRYTATGGAAGDTDTVVLSLTDGASTPITVTLNIAIVAPAAPVAFSGAYSQNFDNLLPTPVPGNNSSLPAAMILPAGWLAAEIGTNSSESIRLDNGGQSTGDSYFYGATGSNERALGTQGSGSNDPVRIGVALRNTTGETITGLSVAFIGEQWRKGGGETNALVFEYSTDATSLGAGTYTEVPQLSFTAPETGANGSLDGNAAANQAAVSATIPGLSWAAGTTIYLRWSDVDSAGTDDGMALDAVSISIFNNVPVAVADAYSVAEDGVLTRAAAQGVLANDTDGDADPLTAVLVDDVDHGALTLNADGSFTYTPAANYNGPDSFTYKANDGAADSNTVTVSLTVDAQNDAPVNTLPPAFDAVEGTQRPLTGIDVADDEHSGPGLPVTFTLTAGALTLSTTVPGGLESGDVTGNGTSAVSVVAPLAKIKATLADPNGVTFDAAGLTYPGSVTLTMFTDDTGLQDSDQATITIKTSNVAPTANDGTLTVVEDTPNPAGILVATDPTSDPLTYTVVSQPAVGGTVLITNATTGAYTFTPAPNFSGTTTFTFKAADALSDSNVATVTVTVTAVDDLPVAVGGTVTTDEDATATGTLSASDAEGDALTFVILTQPANGVVTITNAATGEYSFVPTANVDADSSFTFKATTAGGDSNTATVTTVINAVNDAPVAQAGTLSVTEDTPKTGALVATDADPADTLTYSVVAQPAVGGTVLITNVNTGAYTFTPAANFSGTTSFTFKAFDGTVDSNTATVTVTVNAVNDAPVAQDGALATAEDTSNSGFLAATDVDGPPLTYALLTQPVNGNVTLLNANTGEYKFTPAPDFNGSTSFTFAATDGDEDSNTATISVTIDAVNDAPTIDPISDPVVINEDAGVQTINVTGLSAGPDDEQLTQAVSVTATSDNEALTGPVSVTGSGLTREVKYTPVGNASGTAVITVRVEDNGSPTAFVEETFTVTVTAVNDLPVAANGTVTTDEDTPKAGTLSAADADGDTLTFSIVTQPANGVVTITNAATGAFTFTPTGNVDADSSFTFTASDANGVSNTATVTTVINAVNDLPVAQSGTLLVTEDTPKSGSLTATDVEGETLTYSIASQPAAGGTVLITDATTGAYTFTPAGNFNGTTSFTFTAADAGGTSVPATITVTVGAVNDAPEAADGALSVAEDTPKTGALSATDADGDILTYSVVAQPAAGGTVLITNVNTGAYTFTPAANFSGTTSFTFKAFDGTVDSNTATITVTVGGDNDAPVAQNGTLTVTEDIPNPAGQLVATDADPADTLTYSVVSQPAVGGTVLITNATTGAYTFTPTANYFGTTTFTFKAFDGTVDSNTATVTVTVNAVNDAPGVTVNTGLAVLQGSTTLITASKLVATDADHSSAQLTYQVTGGPANGEIRVNGSAATTFTQEDINFERVSYRHNTVTTADAFTFTVTDGSATTTAATFSITVTTVPTVTASPADASVFEGEQVTFTAAATGHTSVKWQVSMDNGASYADVPGATAATYTTVVTAGLAGAKYRAEFANAAGGNPSAAATLTVKAGLAILDGPAADTIVVGQKASFTAFATGSTKPAVQWQVSTDGGVTFSNITGATKTTYTAPRLLTPGAKALGAQDGNLYRAVFTNAAGKAVTPAALLTVKYTVTLGAAQKLTVKQGTPMTLIAQAPGKVPPSAVGWESSTDGKTYTTISGANKAAYTFTPGPTDSGKRYRAFMNAAGKVTRTGALTLTVAAAPAVTTSPVNATAAAGKATFTAAASGKAAVQWQVSTDGGRTYTNVTAGAKTTSTTAATTSTLTLTKLQSAQTGSLYRAVFATAVGDIASAAAALTV